MLDSYSYRLIGILNQIVSVSLCEGFPLFLLNNVHCLNSTGVSYYIQGF